MTTLTSTQLTQIQQALDNNEYDSRIAAKIHQTEITFKHWKTEQAVNNDVQKLWNAARNGQESLDAEYNNLNDKWFNKGNDRACDYLANAWDCISSILQQLIKTVALSTEETYLSDPTNYPKLGNIPGVHNRYCFYQELHKLEKLAEDKGLDVTNWFDGDFDWDNYPNDPNTAIAVWGKNSTNVYSHEDKKWYSSITFEPSDQGLKQLAEFIKNYNTHLNYAYCDNNHNCETNESECWYCDSANITRGTAKYNDKSVYFEYLREGIDDRFEWEPICYRCFQHKGKVLNVISDAIANVLDTDLTCDLCESLIDAIAHINKRY